MTTELVPALAEFSLGAVTFTVDPFEAVLRLSAIDQKFPDTNVAEQQVGRWQAVAEYVGKVAGAPCALWQAKVFAKEVNAAWEALATADQKKTTPPPASPATSDSTPAPSANASAVPT